VNVIIRNKTQLAIWFSVVARQTIGEDGPETEIVVYATAQEMKPDGFGSGDLVFTRKVESGELFRQEDVPDTSCRPILLGTHEMAGFSIKSMIVQEDEGKRYLMLVYYSEEGDMPGGSPSGDSSEDEPMVIPKAIRLRNSLDTEVFVTIFCAPLLGDNDGISTPDEDLGICIIVYISNTRPPKEKFGRSKILKQRVLHPGHEYILRPLPPYDAIKAYVEDDRYSTAVSEVNTVFGNTLHIDIRLDVDPSDKDE